MTLEVHDSFTRVAEPLDDVDDAEHKEPPGFTRRIHSDG